MVTGSVTGGTNKAIKEINGVYTGVQDVDINVLSSGDNGLDAIDSHDPSVFVVYDSDHYIIAAVVIGEDTSSTTATAISWATPRTRPMSPQQLPLLELEGVRNGAIQTLTIRLSDDMEDFKDLQAEIQGMMNNDDPAPRAENGFVKFEFDPRAMSSVWTRSGRATTVCRNTDVATGTDPEPDDYNAYLVKWGYSPTVLRPTRRLCGVQ